MKAGYKKTVIFIFIALCLLLIVTIAFAGRLLVLDEQPQKADVIIVLGGDRGARLERGVTLFHTGYASHIIVSGGQVYHTTTEAGLMMAHAIELGVPQEALIPETRADSTYENAVFTKGLMEQHGFKSAIVVSSNYHMRRVKFIFERVFKGTGTTLIYCGAHDPIYAPSHWWANNKSIIYTLNEYFKLIGYALGRN